MGAESKGRYLFEDGRFLVEVTGFGGDDSVNERIARKGANQSRHFKRDIFYDDGFKIEISQIIT